MSVLVASYSNPSSSSSPVSPSNGSPSSSSSSSSSSSGLVMRKMSGLQRKRSSKTSRPSSRGGSPLSSPSHSAASSSSVSTPSGSSSNLSSSSSSSSLNGIGSPMASSAMSPSGKTMLICRHVCGCKRRGSDVTVLPSARACSSRGARHDHETNQNLHPKCNSDQPCHYLFAGQRRRASSPNNKPYCAPSPTLSNRALERMQSVSPTMLPTPTSTTRTLASITTSLDQLPLPAPIVPMQPVGTTSLSSHIGVNHSASTSSSSPSVHVLPTFGSAFSAALAHQQQGSTSTALHPTNMKRSSSDYSGQSRSNLHYHQVSSTLYSVKYEEEDDDGDDIDVVSDNHASDRYDSDEVESDSVDDSKFETNTNVSLSSISSASSVSNNHSHHSLNEAHHTHSHGGDHEHSMHDDSSMNGRDRDDVSDSCSSEGGVPMNMAPVFQFSVPSSMTYEAGLSPLEDTSFQLFEPFQNDHHSHHFMQPFSFLDQAADTQAS